MEARPTPLFSVVVPVYNSQHTLTPLYERLKAVFDRELEASFELILVDDASADGSWEVMQALRQRDKAVRIVQLVNNAGQHNALMCGFSYARGAYVITMDDDLQNPPEEIPVLYRAIQQGGLDLVVGVPEEKKHSLFRNTGTVVMNRLHEKVLNKPSHLRFGSFRIFTAEAVARMLALRTSYHYITANILRVISHRRIANVTVQHHSRTVGRSGYTLGRLVKLASNLIINHSAIPLRMGIYLGFFISALCILYGLYIVGRIILVGPFGVAGWATTVVLTSFLFGLLFLFLGIMGEYIYRILNEINQPKPYQVQHEEVAQDDTTTPGPRAPQAPV